MFIESKEILKVLNKNHQREMKGKMGGSVMCICGEGCGGTVACGQMSELVEYIERLEAEIEQLKDVNRWIPVSERMPNEEGKYLGTCQVGDHKPVTLVFWYSEGRTEDEVGEIEGITAWRELPEPYQEDL
jgi:hypothetical protein